MDNHTSHHMMMMMYFHTEIGDDHILFKSWKPSDEKEMAIACLVVVLLTSFYEFFKYLREYIRVKQIDSSSSNAFLNVYHWIQSILHGLQYFISYCLMLIAMTFQVYLIIAILIGAIIGYLIVNPLIEQLHDRQSSHDFGDPCCG